MHPTRASLLTGQYTARNGMWHVIGWYGYPWGRMTEPPFRENLSRETFTLAKGLRAAGYRTGIIGKWHLTTNEDGHYLGLKPDSARHYGFDYAAPIVERELFEEGKDRGVKQLTEQALDFIYRNREQPWFCFLSHHMIHGKVVAPDSLVAKYRALGYGDEGPNRAVYLAGLELIDGSVGQLMKGLTEMGEDRETLVVFVSDNGGIHERLDFKSVEYEQANGTPFPPDITELSNAPLRAGKGSIYEGGTRVPMIIRWPEKVPANKRSEVPVHIIDLAPTFFELAGVESQHILDGESLVDLFGNPSSSPTPLLNRPIFQYYPFYDLRWGLTPGGSVRKGVYKLIVFWGDRVDGKGVYREGRQVELYNLQEDIGETENLVDLEPQIARELEEELNQWLEELGATVPELNPHWESSRALEETREKPEWVK